MKTIEERINTIKEFLAEFNKNPRNHAPEYTWKGFLDECANYIAEIAAGENFRFDSESDVERIPCWNDDNETWSEYAYAYDLVRDGDGLSVIVNKFDGDCSWDEVDVLTEECSDSFGRVFSDYFDTNHYFFGWAEYHLWCAENGGVDPLGSFYNSALSTVEGHLKAAEQNVKYLEM